MRTLVWAEQTELDIDDIADFHEASGFGDGEILIDHIQTAPLALLDFPQMGQSVGQSGLRKWRVQGTPFLLFYRIRGDTIEVIRVVHAASDWAAQI